MSGQADKCNEFFGPLSEHLIQNTPEFPFPPHIKHSIYLLHRLNYETPILRFLKQAL